MQTQTTSTATMTETETFPVYDYWMAGLARQDAAVKASCPDCGGALETVRDFGTVFVQCSEAGCFFCKATGEAN